MNREEILTCYLRFREIANWHKDEAERHLSEAALLRLARKLGIAKGRTLLCENENEYVLLRDLALFLPGYNGGPSAFQRYAKAKAPPQGSDEALVLNAMLRSRCSVWSVKRRHDVAGLVLRDRLVGQDEWFIDMCMEAASEDGFTFAGRLARPAGFSMNCGILAPFREDELFEVLQMDCTWVDADPAAAATNPQFATVLCSAALRTGVMGGVVTMEAGTLKPGQKIEVPALTY